MIRRLYTGQSMEGLPGIIWGDNGEVKFAGRAPNFQNMNATPVPDFDEYFYSRREGGYQDYDGATEALLPIETARGCWWGMKNHCTFCGLNRNGMEFRAKTPERVLDMIKELSERYGQRHFNAIDNILAPEYAEGLFGRLADARSDVRIHYEI